MSQLIQKGAVILFALFLMSPSCGDKEKKSTTQENVQNEQNGENNHTKKDILKYSFNGDYKNLWKEVDSLESIGLYESALNKVKVILTEAGKEKNAPQVLRAVIYKMKYNTYLEEDEYVLAINELNGIAEKSEFPLNQLIHSVTADVYWGYYETNRWRFMDRSQTVNFKNDDIRTWDLKKIVSHVNNHYLLSLSSSDSLKRSNINDFKEILISYNQTDKLRPTLYDFLANKALDYFQNPESGLSRPDDKFTVEGQNFFGDSHAFLQVSTLSDDTLSNALHATRIFKDLTSFHLNDKDPAALIDLELRRLQFARTHSMDEQKDNWYIQALERLAEKYISHPGYSEIKYNAAQYYYNIGLGYTKEKPELQWKIKKALDLCTEGKNKYPTSYGTEQCKSLGSIIHYKNMSFMSEKAEKPMTEGKFLFKYKNINKVYFRLVEVNWDFFFKNRLYGDELVSHLLNLPVENKWSEELRNPGDYQEHSTELKLPAKELGQYVLLASHDPEFRLEKNAIAYGSFWSSNLGYSLKRNDNETYDVFVTDRETGFPLEGVTGTVYTNKYNFMSRNYELEKQESYNSDEKGLFTVRSRGDYRSIYVDLNKDGDHYNELSQLYLSKPYKRDEGYSTTNFFTDRAIYRPGQKIYFKGIRIRHNGDNHTIEAGKTSTVKFYDANYQVVSEVKVTTNEYGTFSGSFTAPEGGMNGQMRIQDEFGSHYFSVEEYKRPKFEVVFSPVKGVFKIGEKIKIDGNAKAFAGSNIDGTKVQFRVVRNCNFSYWTFYKYGYYPNSGSTEIMNGTVKTDENGAFTIEFSAKEDKTIDKKFHPIYNYTVYADVTDITGETRSSSQYVIVGYNAMNLSVGLPSKFDRSDRNKFKVATTNLMGEKINATGTITVNRLIESEEIYRSALWNRPDISKISEEEFRRLFPHDQFNNELDLAQLKIGERVLEMNFNTENSDSITIEGLKSWKPGKYIIETKSIDAFGEEVSDVIYFTVLDKNSTASPTKDIWSFTSLKTVCEPGEKAEFLISSAADLKVLYEIEHKGKIVSRQIISLNNSQQKISIPIEEKHRGNLNIHFSAVKYGRAHNSHQTIVVPFTNKELDISFETFRDKLQPGQKEEWKIKIKGPKGEKVAAEMLAAMYDASLDEFASNMFNLNIWNSYYSSSNWYSYAFSVNNSNLNYKNWDETYSFNQRQYDQLNWWGYNYTSYYYGYYRGGRDFGLAEGVVMADELEAEEVTIVSRSLGNVSLKKNKEYKNSESEAFGFASDSTITGSNKPGDNRNDKDDEKRELSGIQARTNLNEMAFFMPQLKTNEKGEVIISFTIPESLTKWNFIGLAHTKDLKTGYVKKEVVTQKELMVMPNAPRFLREGDAMTFTAKVSNLSEGDLSGNAQLLLFDALTMEPVDVQFDNSNAKIPFSALKGQSALLKWDLIVPSGIGAVTYRIVAQAKNHTDGEESTLPILSNRMLVTESLPLPSKGIGTKDFHFEKLLNSGTSTSIKNHKLTLEYTSNPAWYAIQALPYMMEYPHECAEQTFSRFYANSLASAVVRSNPKIKDVFESWKDSSPEAFLSNLEKNQELKSVILQETPWVLDAQNENERKKRVALLFELNKMDRELERALNKLEKMQVSNGGWPWFPGMEESRYITQHVITGMGHLDNLAVRDIRENKKVWNMIQKGVQYLDERMLEDYNWIITHYPDYKKEKHISELEIQYLYARSYFKDIPFNGGQYEEAINYFQEQAKTYWKEFNIYNEGMIALEAKRFGITELPEMVMASLKERAIYNDEMGMYWKDNITGYYWYQAPIETQALLIEAFDEVTNDQSSVEELKVWLLKQKQTTDWKTTKATAEACYALLLRGTSLLMNTEQVEIKMNGKVIDPKVLGAKVEAGTGYFKTSWDGEKITPEMGNISVTRKTEGVSWGALYWQYFEDLDKITPHDTPLKLNKKLFLVVHTESGPVITPITDGTALKPGDKVRVRIELRSDRDMEYIHMRDMRAAGFEPINVFSQYKWQDGLGYYESTGDAATNFFMDYLRKGTYVFEYDMRVTHYGDFSNGITTIQCMYAPEFTSHSEGIRVEVKEEKK